jgi:septal ring factor EnvC (AmiA/AmiB activator)
MFLLFELFSAREIIMLDHRLLCVPAILMLLVISAAAQENVKPYSPQEIDSMLGSLRNNVSTEVDTKLNVVNSSLADLDKKLDTYKSSLTDLNKKLDAYRSSLADLDKKLDVYKSSLITDMGKKLDALKTDLQASQKVIDGKLSAITTDTSGKMNDLGQRAEAEIKALESRMPTAPWLSAALLGALFGLAASFAFTRYSAPRSDAQRRTDAAGSPS